MDDAAKAIFSVRPRLKSFSVLEFDNVYSEKEHRPNYHELLYLLEGRMTLHLGKILNSERSPEIFC